MGLITCLHFSNTTVVVDRQVLNFFVIMFLLHYNESMFLFVFLGTQTDTFSSGLLLSSTPLKGNVSGVQGSRPAKRPRLEEDEKEDVSVEIPEPHDSTHNPEDSVTVVT